MEYNEKVFEADGIKLRYILRGQGKPILFLHCGGVKAATYKRNIELLSQKYKVIAPDIPCFGESSIPNDRWNFDDFANFFSKFIEFLNLQDITLVGHSFGGGIATVLSTKTEKISKLILIDSAGLRPHYSKFTFFWILVLKTFRGFGLTENLKIPLTMLKDFLSEAIGNFFSLDQIFKIVMDSVYSDYDFLRNISIPTYIFWGDSDELFDKKYAEQFNQKISHSKTEFIKGNHDWCLLQPQKFFEKIMKIVE